MKVLITGNMGYVGPVVVAHLRREHPQWTIHGYDSGYFAHCLTGAVELPERLVDRQLFGDVREIGPRLLEGYDGVIQLAAISNDPMGSRFADVTQEINCTSAVAIARAAQVAGVRTMVYASSCSVYGIADGPRRETDPVAPLTAYARSKVEAEEGFASLAGTMLTTSLRFATACGMSDRLRLDLVVNDFVASAVASNEITILSDGTPWRPLIDVRDMARAIEWALQRGENDGGRTLVVNAGCEGSNYRVLEVAEAVASVRPAIKINVNASAPVDSRSYQVNFDRFAGLTPNHRPKVSLIESIEGLIEGLERMKFGDRDFRNSAMMRLHVLNDHVASGRLSPGLRWTQPQP
jgi:nucleoside-diphosphate-sugar epimerase